MRKTLALVCASYFIVASAAISIYAYKSSGSNNSQELSSVSEDVNNTYSENEDKQLSILSPSTMNNSNTETANNDKAEGNQSSLSQQESSSSKDTPEAISTSRGGSGISGTSENKIVSQKKETVQSTATESKVETLDWWKSARYVFPRGAEATVQDVYTGKTFKVVRTMGTNHADTEAASATDTKIIKSIWGGFSWTRRPVIVIINGRRLAASMSAMPHAGLDSAPAYANVKGRSGGYGSGQNLDVIKNNDMNGHFDIHFLNSTRHKDGQPDPQHQAMIKIAGKQ